MYPILPTIGEGRENISDRVKGFWPHITTVAFSSWELYRRAHNQSHHLRALCIAVWCGHDDDFCLVAINFLRGMIRCAWRGMYGMTHDSLDPSILREHVKNRDIGPFFYETESNGPAYATSEWSRRYQPPRSRSLPLFFPRPPYNWPHLRRLLIATLLVALHHGTRSQLRPPLSSSSCCGNPQWAPKCLPPPRAYPLGLCIAAQYPLHHGGPARCPATQNAQSGLQDQNTKH